MVNLTVQVQEAVKKIIAHLGDPLPSPHFPGRHKVHASVDVLSHRYIPHSLIIL